MFTRDEHYDTKPPKTASVAAPPPITLAVVRRYKGAVRLAEDQKGTPEGNTAQKIAEEILKKYCTDDETLRSMYDREATQG